jgi:hypothetical protein
MYEVRFTSPFAKRPSVLAVQNVPGEYPTLIPLGYVDPAKFGFYQVSNQPEVRIIVD